MKLPTLDGSITIPLMATPSSKHQSAPGLVIQTAPDHPLLAPLTRIAVALEALASRSVSAENPDASVALAREAMATVADVAKHAIGPVSGAGGGGGATPAPIPSMDYEVDPSDPLEQWLGWDDRVDAAVLDPNSPSPFGIPGLKPEA